MMKSETCSRLIRHAGSLAALLVFVSKPLAALESANSEETRYGAHVGTDRWVHFVVHAPLASAVDLLLYDSSTAQKPKSRLAMRQEGDDWKLKVRNSRLGPGSYYMYQATGPREVSADRPYGTLFNGNYVLNDPYAYLTGNVNYSTFFTATPFVDMGSPVYGGGGKSRIYNHSLDQFPGHVAIAPQDLVLYELHIQDFTAALPGLPARERGTYRGLTRVGLKTPGGLAAGLDHLVELGVNAVELMPVMEYDEQTGNEAGRLNHWGYMTSNFFAPEARYAARPGQQVVEFKDLVRALHARGIAVFMDVVYNHTAEGVWRNDQRLAAKCFNVMCLATREIYRPSADPRYYNNDTGTGNDIDYSGSERFSKRLVRDSLAMWHQVYGIDGFRFDLARILAVGSENAADWVDNDPRYAAAHLHAEPWDTGGQWWDFMDDGPGWSAENNRWAKWLGRYRDKMRRFSKSDLRSPGEFKQLIEGRGAVSDGQGPAASSRPWRSINFLAVHDGYTLRDCTWFNDNDGSQNCWDSGSDEETRRIRQKLLLGVLLTSQGVPLILQGDEFGQSKAGAQSQEGARNSYNYESTTGDPAINRVNWLDWRLKDGDNSVTPSGARYGRELFDWTRRLIAMRKQWSHFRRSDFAPYVEGRPDDRSGRFNDGAYTYSWEGPGKGEATQLAVIWWGKAGEPDLMVIYNENPQDFTVDNLQDWSQGQWKILARSWLPAGEDFCAASDWQSQCPEAGSSVSVAGRSMAILISDNN
ncbi:MAG TPA: alpha-amylase family glycosyl hydrolase [Accumulibacter sp.]|nr:alpha-amylase family glycosyl hydrolase [Accumulibacter sp.]HPP47245.1 alpha-amylase family glycosyl hydrolase [Accumulibacter sp.]